MHQQKLPKQWNFQSTASQTQARNHQLVRLCLSVWINQRRGPIKTSISCPQLSHTLSGALNRSTRASLQRDGEGLGDSREEKKPITRAASNSSAPDFCRWTELLFRGAAPLPRQNRLLGGELLHRSPLTFVSAHTSTKTVKLWRSTVSPVCVWSCSVEVGGVGGGRGRCNNIIGQAFCGRHPV